MLFILLLKKKELVTRKPAEDPWYQILFGLSYHKIATLMNRSGCIGKQNQALFNMKEFLRLESVFKCFCELNLIYLNLQTESVLLGCVAS